MKSKLRSAFPIPACLIAACLIIGPVPIFAQLSPAALWATHAANEYQVYPNVTYLNMGGVDLKLDVYRRRTATSPQPTVIYMHGGFWVAGNKEGAILSLLPWMEMGWNVVNVEYRLGAAALAPAALEDCFCALRFLGAQAQTQMYNIDTSRIVVTGESAGGHLALALGTIPESEGLDRECAGAALPKVAAVINWFGISDVPDVIDGPHRANAAVRWFGSLPNRMEIARRVSPMTYVRSGLPPIMTIHGDADMTVPYQQAVRLHQALAKVNVPNQLLTIPGGGHGNFTPEQRDKIYITIREFLVKNGLGPK
jgi:acetyl esterase/lipase